MLFDSRQALPFKIYSITQNQLSWLLAIYIGFFLNLGIFYQRFFQLSLNFHIPKAVVFLIEAGVLILLCYGLLRLASLAGSLFFKIIACTLLLISLIASYYMHFFNIVIGYGVIISTLSLADAELSKELLDSWFYLWLVTLSALPLWMIWRNKSTDTLLTRFAQKETRLSSALLSVLLPICILLPLELMHRIHKQHDIKGDVDMPRYSSVLASSYLPINWLRGLAIYLDAHVFKYAKEANLFDPSQHFIYQANSDLKNTYVIFIIGETTRWDHLGLLGYPRDTTPQLKQEANLIAFKGIACDTATKLSLRCMFVREGGATEDEQRTLTEQNVFAVLRELGFSSEVYSLQNEGWFYPKTKANYIESRDTIAAKPENTANPNYDAILLPELQRSLQKYPHGKHLVILHTKGSHYAYNKRYSAQFAKFQPDCSDRPESCSMPELINGYDNTVLSMDDFMKQVFDQVRNKKAIVFYAADHGESLTETEHFHATPRHIAPDEQFRVPILVWASDTFLQEPLHAANFAKLRRQAEQSQSKRHVELFDSVLGCLGFTSPNGGLNAENNWCD